MDKATPGVGGDIKDLEEIHTCKKCGSTKPVVLFEHHTYKGVKTCSGTCRDCRSAYDHKRYSAKSDHWKKYFQNYWQEKGKKLEAQRERLYPEKRKARRAVRNAIQNGRMLKIACHVCEDKNSEFHHTHGYDEANWFMGIWVCRSCHTKLHRIIREGSLV